MVNYKKALVLIAIGLPFLVVLAGAIDFSRKVAFSVSEELEKTPKELGERNGPKEATE